MPQGLVIPMLVLGGTMGRLFAVLYNKVRENENNDHLQALDPGLWAQVGAAAFWCGSGRITATIAIIVLEVTGEYSYLPAIGIAVIAAKPVGNQEQPPSCRESARGHEWVASRPSE